MDTNNFFYIWDFHYPHATCGNESNRQTDRQTDSSQAERQTDRQTNRQTDRQTDRNRAGHGSWLETRSQICLKIPQRHRYVFVVHYTELYSILL